MTNRYENYLRAFRLNGTRCEAISLPKNRFWLQELELGLALWQGKYQQTNSLWLRWYNAAGWVLTSTEQAEQECQRAERLAKRLRRRVRVASRREAACR